MKNIFLILLLIVNHSHADVKYDESPSVPFSTSSNKQININLNWITTNNVLKLCNAESKKRGFGVYRQNILACSFWDGNSCSIITSKTPTMHTIGHEIRHCYQGHWHSDTGQK